MNTLFITFDFHEHRKPVKSVAVATLESYLKDNICNIEVDTFSFNMNDEYSVLFDQMANLKRQLTTDLDFVLVSFYAWNMRFLSSLISIIQESSPNARLVAGGYEVTTRSVSKLKVDYPQIDHFIIGYAEKSLELLLKNEDSSKVLNYCVDNNSITEIYSNHIINVDTESVVRLETKRGCPSKCSFCAYKNNDHENITVHSINKVKRELSFLNELGVAKVNILDPIFTLKNYNELLNYLVEIKFKPKISFQMKFEILYQEIYRNPSILNKLDMLKVDLEFGLQSISKKVLSNVERENDLEKIKKVVQALNSHNITYEVSIIRGLPGETQESFVNLKDFLDKIKCKNYVTYPLTLLTNTKLYDDKDKLKIKTISQNGLEYVIETYSYNYVDYVQMI